MQVEKILCQQILHKYYTRCLFLNLHHWLNKSERINATKYS